MIGVINLVPDKTLSPNKLTACNSKSNSLPLASCDSGILYCLAADSRLPSNITTSLLKSLNA